MLNVQSNISGVARIFTGLVLIAMITVMIPAPHPVDAAVCGMWEASQSPEEGRFAVHANVESRTTPGGTCATVVETVNTSAVLGLLGGYTMEMGASGEDNMTITWASFGKRYSDHLFLTQLFDSKSDAVVREIDAPGSATIYADITVASIALDTILFVLQSILEALPINCAIDPIELFGVAVDLIPEATDVAENVAEIGFNEAFKILPATIERILDRSEAFAVNFIIGCGADIAERLFSAGTITILKIAANYLAWIPKVFVDYFGYSGTEAHSSITFKPAVQPTPTPEPTATVAPTSTPISTPTPTPEPVSVGEIAYIADGHRPLESSNYEIWLRSVEAGEERQFTMGREPRYQNIQFSSDGRYLMYLHWPEMLKRLYVYDFDAGREISMPGQVICAAFSPDADWLHYITADGDWVTGEFEIDINYFWLDNFGHRGLIQVHTMDLLELLGLDQTSGARLSPFGPQQATQGCQTVESSGGWVYLTLGLDVPTACDFECPAIPVTFRTRVTDSGTVVELVSSPVAVPSLSKWIPATLDHIRDSLGLTVEGASSDGALTFVRSHVDQGRVVLLWDAAGVWREVAPGTSASLSWDGSILFVTDEYETPITYIFSIRDGKFRDETIPGSNVAQRPK